MNIGYGLHDMPSSSASHLTVTNAEISNIAWGAILFMDQDGGSVTIDSVLVDNVGVGIDAQRLSGSTVSITNMDVGVSSLGIVGIAIKLMSGDITVEGNTIRSPSEWSALALEGMSDAKVRSNTFIDITGRLRPGRGAIFVGSWNGRASTNNTIEGNHYRRSGINGWLVSSTGIVRNGAVTLGGASAGNVVAEEDADFFQGSTACGQIVDLSVSAASPSGLNTILANGEPCSATNQQHLANMLLQWEAMQQRGRELSSQLGNLPYHNWPAR